MSKRHEALAHMSFDEYRTTADLAARMGCTNTAAVQRLRGLQQEGAVVSRVTFAYWPHRNEWAAVPGFVPKEGRRRVVCTHNTIALVNEHMNVVQYQSASELGKKFGCRAPVMAQKLLRLYEAKIVERVRDSSGRRYLWRKVPEGFIAPLYDAQPGVCGRALDDALGGFTYLKANSKVGASCSIRQQ